MRNGRRQWVCLCDCGTEREVSQSNLLNGASSSCGCSKRTHGHSLKGKRSPTMRSYEAMVARCLHPSNPSHEHYLARGIGVCDRWLAGEDGKTGFECFLSDVGERPSLSLTLERKDNDLGYFPGNVRWASRLDQARNRTTTRLFPFRGRSALLREISLETGVTFDALRWRIEKLGMDIDAAVSVPVQKGQNFSRPTPIRTYKFLGQQRTVREIAVLTGVNLSTLKYRLSKGQSIEESTRR